MYLKNDQAISKMEDSLFLTSKHPHQNSDPYQNLSVEI